MKVLLYGFEKYQQLPYNPSEKIVHIIQKEIAPQHQTRVHILSVNTKCKKQIDKTLQTYTPDVVIGIGASDRPLVSLEYYALNMIDSPQPHNDKRVIRHTKIDTKSPLALETNIDIVHMKKFLQGKGIPVTISYYAGTYLCNYAYFTTLDHIRKNKLPVQAIFLHIPLSPEIVNTLEVNKPSFPLKLIAQAISEYIQKGW